MLRNAVKAFWAAHDLPIGSFIRTEGFDIKFEASSVTKLDAAKVLEMYENEEITRDDFIRMLNLDKVQAKNILGGDIVASLEFEQVGKTADIRLEHTPIENINDEFVGVAVKERSRVKSRKLIGKVKSRTSTGVKIRPRRRIKVRSP